MKYMVFVIYIISIMQFINSKSVAKNGICRGRDFYKISGVINMIVGWFGMVAGNVLLRDKNIIPQAFVWIALIGFGITMVYGMYCIYKMMITVEP